LDNIIANNAQGIDDLRRGFEENISNIMSTNVTINENFNGLQIKSEETWKALEDVKKHHNEDISTLTKNIDSEKERIDNIEEEMKELDDTITQITTDIEKNTDRLNELENAKVVDRAGMDETKHLILEIDSKLKTLDAGSNDRLKKAEEDIKTNADQIGLLDGSTKYITEQITNLFKTNITIDEKIQDLNGKAEKICKALKVNCKIWKMAANIMVRKLSQLKTQCIFILKNFNMSLFWMRG
jgi:chromosome segregation ATPase